MGLPNEPCKLYSLTEVFTNFVVFLSTCKVEVPLSSMLITCRELVLNIYTVQYNVYDVAMIHVKFPHLFKFIVAVNNLSVMWRHVKINFYDTLFVCSV